MVAIMTLLLLLILLAGSEASWARATTPAATLVIELQNVVQYQVDTSDLSKWGTNPGITPGKIAKGMGVGCVGVPVVAYGDIVSVNGQPARGTYVSRAVSVCMRTTPVPGVNAIADTTWASVRDETYQILQSDGVTPIGTIMVTGLNNGSPSPPGPQAGNQNYAIVGGTGAFLGARGQKGNYSINTNNNIISPRGASITEDPANRRVNGGGHVQAVLTVFPMFTPQILEVTHTRDSTGVNSARPADSGEILSILATGLGPTRPGLDPGKPFPPTPASQVNSPLQVTVNEKIAEVLSAVGSPGAVDQYQVKFRVPPGTKSGMAAVQVTAAWISSAPVSIPIQ